MQTKLDEMMELDARLRDCEEKRKNVEKRAAINYKDAIECTTLLAAAQAREGVLRGFIFDYTEIEPNNEAMIARYDICVKPTDDTALKAALAAERERCAFTCERLPYLTGFEGRTFADAIRAMGDDHDDRR